MHIKGQTRVVNKLIKGAENEEQYDKEEDEEDEKKNDEEEH